MNSIKKFCFIMLVAIITIFLMNLISFATTEGKITDETVRLRKEASTDSDTISLLAKDAKVDVIEKSGDWYVVKYEDNTGYVHKDYIELQDEASLTTSSENSNNTENEASSIEENSNEENNVTTQSNYKTVEEEQSLYIVPLINSRVINNIAPNTKISLIKEVNGWSYITSDEVSGWIRTDKLVNIQEDTEGTVIEEETVEEQEIEATETKIGYIKVDGANLRKSASTSSEILTVLYKNTEVTVLSSENGWSKVKSGNTEGYISSDLISDKKIETTTTSRSTIETRTNTTNQETTSETMTESSNSSSDSSIGQQIVNFAMKYKGYPYVYGGAGPSSFDCSGFTQYVYKQFGYSLPHSATSQSYCGTRVSKSELRLGDLVIFTEAGSSSIGHVGIYIGNSSFIHASTPSTGVIVSSLNGYYESRYVTGVRIY